jgi:hypothetical protein
MSRPLTYWASGGEIRAADRPLEPVDAQAMLGVHLDEARAAVAAGASSRALRALELAGELNRAVLRLQDWRAAAAA